MKIVMFLEYYRPYAYATSGVIVAIERLTAGLIGRGHRVLWVVPEGAERPCLSVELEKFPVLPRLTKMPIRSLAPSISGLRTIADRFSPDIIHAHNPFVSIVCGLVLAKMCRCPLVYTAHTMFPEYAHYANIQIPGLRRFLAWWLKHACIAADLVTVPTRMAQRYIRGIGYAGSSHIVPTGVDTTKFFPVDNHRRSELRTAQSLKSEDFVVMFCGRLASEKNIFTLIDAIRLINDRRLKLLMVGDGPLQNQIESLIAGTPIEENVLVVGGVVHDLLPDYYRVADCLVHPSLTEFQALVVLEAMACGVPVIAPQGTAQAEFIMSGVNGLLTRPDPDSQSLAIQQIMTDSNLRKQLADGSRLTAGQHTVEEYARAIETVYRIGARGWQ